MDFRGSIGLWGAVIFALLVGVAAPTQDFAILSHGGDQPPLNGEMVGIYAIRLRCAKGESHCEPDRLSGADRISVVDSFLNTGVSIMISSKSHLHGIDRFLDADVSSDGNSVSATPSERFGAPGVFSYIEVHFEPGTQRLTGTVLHTNTLAKHTFEAKPLRTVGQFKSTSPPSVIGVDQIVGKYKGRIGRYPGTLFVRELPNRSLVGHFKTDRKVNPDLPVPILEIDFTAGQWSAQSGILQLTFTLPRLGGVGELVLAYRGGSPGKPRMEGFQFAAFSDLSASFVKTR